MALSDNEILAIIDSKASEAYGFQSSTLTNEREKALKYYLGEPYGNEVDGRSQVVTRDVLETIEWMLPSLLRVFNAGDKVVEFVPVSQEDIKPAEQESDVVNHVVMQQNNSFMLFYTWFKDALLSKNSYVKVYWDTSEETVEDNYTGLMPEEVAMLQADPGVEIVYAEQTETGIALTLKRVNKTGKVCIDVVPPEEILIDTACRSLDLDDCAYIEHRTQKTISDIRLMGFDIPDDIAESDNIDGDDSVRLARDIYDEQQINYEGADASTRLVWFRDVTLKVDADGDGIADLMRYYIVGKEIIWQGKAENIYYAALGPLPMPHRHVGLSLADLVMDIQLIRSTILRQYLDGMYLANNGRYAISDRVNLDDMLVSRPGGVVRVQGMPGEGHIMPLVHPNTGAYAIEGLNYLDTQKENRTGITKYNQGLDSNSLNKTATGISQIMNAAQQRMELIARVFAETGVKRLFSLVHELLKKHSDKPMIMRLRNEWVPVDPRQWQTRTDMRVSVGLGNGNKDAQLQHLMSIMQVQREALAIGITDPSKIYAAAKRLAENAGFSDGDEFFTDPSGQPPKPPQPDPKVMAEQQKMQADIQIQQMKMQAEAQAEQAKLQNSIQLEQAKLQLEREKLQIQANTDIEIAKYKADLEAQVKMQIAQYEAQYRTNLTGGYV